MVWTLKSGGWVVVFDHVLDMIKREENISSG